MVSAARRRRRPALMAPLNLLALRMYVLMLLKEREIIEPLIDVACSSLYLDIISTLNIKSLQYYNKYHKRTQHLSSLKL